MAAVASGEAHDLAAGGRAPQRGIRRGRAAAAVRDPSSEPERQETSAIMHAAT